MDTIKIGRINEIDIKIRRNNKNIERNIEIIKNIKRLNIKEDVKQEKIKDIQNQIDILEKDNNLLKEEEKNYRNGNLDQELKKEIKNNKIYQKPIKKKEVNYYEKENKERNDNRDKDREIENSWKYYTKVVDSLPEHMNKKLDDMTSNKGYIWRNCWFFGRIYTPQTYPTVLFEKMKGKMRIHELTKTEYKIFEKEGDKRKVLIDYKRRG